MTFAGLSTIAVGAGGFALAAILFLLQLLRVRRREVQVATTLFWREALGEAPRRRLWQSFRHWLAWLLLLAICLSLWLALAEPELERSAVTDKLILVLDGSAGMARGDRFKRAVARLQADVMRADPESRTVIWAGADVITLLAPGEPAALLAKRLQTLSPQAAPATVERLLRQLGRIDPQENKTAVLIYGDAPVRKEILARLPDSLSVRRAMPLPPVSSNAGLTALGVAEALDNPWSKVDAFFTVYSDQPRRWQRSDFHLLLDDVELSDVVMEPVAADEARKTQSFLLRNLDATGAVLQVALIGTEQDIRSLRRTDDSRQRSASLALVDDLSLDDVARVRLPRRPPIRLYLSASLQEVLGPVLAADSAIELTNAGYQIAVVRRGERVDADVSRLEFVPKDAQAAAFLAQYPEDAPAETALANIVRSVGLDVLDVADVAQSTHATVGVVAQKGDRRTLSIWQEALNDDAGLTRSRGWPIFVARTVRWLSNATPSYQYAAAGKPLLPAPEAQIAGSFATGPLDSLGITEVPAEASSTGDAPLPVSLLDPMTTSNQQRRAADGLQIDAATSTEALSLPAHAPFIALLLIALVLLALEWQLYRTARVP